MVVQTLARVRGWQTKICPEIPFSLPQMLLTHPIADAVANASYSGTARRSRMQGVCAPAG
jgi:hypothetical protein